eukprot:12893190-Prorocentrum_lima.AAC.1
MEQPLVALELMVQELRDRNQQLQGTLDEQRAWTAKATAGTSARRGVKDTRLPGEPKNFSGRDEVWQ